MGDLNWSKGSSIIIECHAHCINREGPIAVWEWDEDQSEDGERLYITCVSWVLLSSFSLLLLFLLFYLTSVIKLFYVDAGVLPFSDFSPHPTGPWGLKGCRWSELAVV